MKGHVFPAEGKMRFGWALGALVAAAVLPLTARGAERVVLAEDFTNVN